MAGGRKRHFAGAAAAGALAVAGTFGAAPAAATATVTGQGDVRTFGNSILVTMLNIDSTTDAPARCATVVFDTAGRPVITDLQEIYDGGLGIWWTTMPTETLHLAGQYTGSADYRVTTECRDDDGVVRLADTVVTLPEGELVGNPTRYSELFGPF
ncbi:3-oxoacyl-ACP synthase [Prescottella equi]|uniref:3-oxoacyl-ACP synthase n=1 Tax=Rhodococcus hoagii TaxID=43767 RepID=UPI001161E1AC|nr:3-oxoacyl-ACP synthase [Prescottella equi]QDP10187.1 3-oxoacyl-ACP synthase [Prescottella equi]